VGGILHGCFQYIAHGPHLFVLECSVAAHQNEGLDGRQELAGWVGKQCSNRCPGKVAAGKTLPLSEHHISGWLRVSRGGIKVQPGEAGGLGENLTCRVARAGIVM
jgi:hypothetical protein